MRNSSARQTATSLPASPEDDAAARSKKYLVMMAIRLLCFLLMVVITPYGWYTAVLGLAAIFLPYIAVVMANAGDTVRRVAPENPERALPAAPEPAAAPVPGPTVIRIQETRAVEDQAKDEQP